MTASQTIFSSVVGMGVLHKRETYLFKKRGRGHLTYLGCVKDLRRDFRVLHTSQHIGYWYCCRQKGVERAVTWPRLIWRSATPHAFQLMLFILRCFRYNGKRQWSGAIRATNGINYFSFWSCSNVPEWMLLSANPNADTKMGERWSDQSTPSSRWY